MPTKNDYKEFVLEQLSGLSDITVKPMMGEFLLYYKSVLFGGIYDDRLLFKKTENGAAYGMDEVLPYEGGKPMYHADFIDDGEKVKELVLKTYEDLIKKR